MMTRIKIPDDRILILDGAMGTMIQRYLPSADGNNDRLNIDSPETISRIHREYIEAGADIIETNTFSSNRISQSEYGLADRAREMAYAGARTARETADRYIAEGRMVYVAGSVGPTSKSLSLSADERNSSFRQYGFDDMAGAYKEQIEALIEGGADFILLETCFDALNTKAALYALSRLFPDRDFPVSVSVSTSDRSGRTLTGQTLEAFYTAVRHYPLLSFGLNCSLGAAGLTPLIKDVASFSECAVSCYPNAGLPNEMGRYDETPEKMAADMKAMAEESLLNIAGGCCGTTPEHIRAISLALEGIKPRVPGGRTAKRGLTVSGLETVTIDAGNSRLTNIGERTNVAGSRKFARLISGKNYEEALAVAADQIEGGANIIDISLDDAMLDNTHEMTVFTRYISNDPNVAKAALMIDSSHEETLLAGLKNAQGKSIVNSISLKDGEKEFLRKAREINRAGHRLREEDRSVRKGVQASHAGGRHPARGHHLRRQCPDHCYRDRGTFPLCNRFHRCGEMDKGQSSGGSHFGRHFQPVIRIQGQQQGQGGDALCLPLSCRKSGPRHGDCKSFHAGSLRRHRT